jgi:hypothetical protein
VAAVLHRERREHRLPERPSVPTPRAVNNCESRANCWNRLASSGRRLGRALCRPCAHDKATTPAPGRVLGKPTSRARSQRGVFHAQLDTASAVEPAEVRRYCAILRKKKRNHGEHGSRSTLRRYRGPILLAHFSGSRRIRRTASPELRLQSVNPRRTRAMSTLVGLRAVRSRVTDPTARPPRPKGA